MFELKNKYNIDDLRLLMKALRAPNGCSWDREQTHKSVRNNFIEEVYEVVEAIDMDSPAMLREELGDVLLQVIFHCEMESEQGNFDFDDVCDEISQKLVVRHPHVFGDVSVNSTSEVLENWDKIKQRTKGQDTFADTLNSVPKTFPSLMRAEKLGKRAGRAGMDFNNVQDALEYVKAETLELEQAIARNDRANIEEEVGDLLFSCVNVARLLGVCAEEALSKSLEKFIERFALTEKLIRLEGKNIQSLSIDEIDVFWDIAKKQLS